MNSVQSQPTTINVTLNVPPDLVFDAWTKPSLMHKWLFAAPSSEIVNIETELEVNGQYSILEWRKNSNEYIDHTGEYLVFEKPAKLSFTLLIPKLFEGSTTVTVDLSEISCGCELRLTQTGIDQSLMQEQWKEMLQQLKLVLENQ